MYRVIIVDDEEPVLDSFSFILEKESENFMLCGKARSGTEAIRLIRELKPDLVFMDIQMPGIDGIDTISQIRTQYPEIVFILATAYERFDIAQKAIPLGVFSYLVKPISRKSFIAELNRVKIHLDRTRQGNNLQIEDIRFLQKTKEEARKKFLSGLVWGNPSQEEWETISRLFSFTCKRGSVFLVGLPDDVSEEKKEVLYGKLSDRIRYKFNCLHTTLTGRLMLFFPEDQSLDKLDQYIGTITGDFQPVTFTIGRGGVYEYTRLADSFSEAFRIFREIRTGETTYFSEKESMQAVCSSMLKSDFARAHRLFEDFWTRIFRNDPFDVAKGKMVALFTLLYNGIDDRILTAGCVDINPAEKIMLLRNVEEWQLWSTGAMAGLEKLLRKYDARPLPHHLSRALEIIRKRYNEPIQLSSIAEECQITSGYLCRLFSEYLGTSFIEYLNRYRIEQATILLRDNHLSIKEASGMVGYQDANYFSRIFRRYLGLSPSELVNRRIRDGN